MADDLPDWTAYVHSYTVTTPKGEVPAPVTKIGNFDAAQTDTVIWEPAAGKAIVLISILCSTAIAGKFELKRNGVAIAGALYFADTGGATIAGGGTIWTGAVDEKITLTTDIAGAHSITLTGSEQ